jgi:ribosomal protein L37AE/L43A
MATPSCALCGAPKIQRGRYADWRCTCCDESVNCPHVSGWKRFLRKLSGRKV